MKMCDNPFRGLINPERAMLAAEILATVPGQHLKTFHDALDAFMEFDEEGSKEMIEIILRDRDNAVHPPAIMPEIADRVCSFRRPADEVEGDMS